jgi:hypothetical protein
MTSFSTKLSSIAARLMRNRHKIPKFLNVLIDDVAKKPDGFLAWIVDSLLLATEQTPVITKVPDSSKRLFIGPTNYAGQGYAWSRALEEADPLLNACNIEIELPGSFQFPADSKVSISAYNRSRNWQRKELEAVQSFTHVLYEAERPLFGSLFQRNVKKEVRALQSSDVSVALMCHGTDVRSPKKHVSLTEWSPYVDEVRLAAQHQKEVDANLKLIADLQLPTFVSTPDLLLDLPEAHWCPVVVDTRVWQPVQEPLLKTRPVVVHIPSMGKIKGTHLIHDTLLGLDSEGLIEYQALSGVPAFEMPKVIAEADIVLDQFRIGSYGVAAVEAMSTGRVVVGHVAQEVRSIVMSQTGSKLPVVEATPATLAQVLREICENRTFFQNVALEGHDFVRAIHSGKFSATVLETHWIADAQEQPLEKDD